MIEYNLKIAIRNLSRQKKISLLNLFGLSVGMSVAILIFSFVSFEMSYDNFHPDGDRIYRIISIDKSPNGDSYNATTALPLPFTIRQDLRNVEMVTGLGYFLGEGDPVDAEGRTWFNLTGCTADSYFLKMFNFPLLRGNADNVFDNPTSIVLTEQTARKLFGDADPVGKELTIDQSVYTVNGILKDLPENSIFKFDLLVSNLILNKKYPNLLAQWWNGGVKTFVKLYSRREVQAVKSGLAEIPGKYFPDFMKGRKEYTIQKLQDIHLDDRVADYDSPPVSVSYLYILLAIAVAVLFIACANFVNLSTSQSEKRAKETGIRKLSGAGRFQLTRLFVGESVVLSLGALLFAVLLARLSLPWFNELTQRNLEIHFTGNRVLLLLLIFGITTGILSGIYPALLFSKYKPVQAFRARMAATGNKTGFRKCFIIAQFVITILLITSQLFITRQVSFLKNHDLGFDDENLLSIPLGFMDEEKRLSTALLLAEKIRQEGTAFSINDVTLTENVPGQNFPNEFAVIPEGASGDHFKEMVVSSIDGSYAGVFRIPLVSGRMLSDDIPSDKYKSVLINETAARKFGWNDPVGKQLRFKHERDPYTIVGVLKDINFRSLQANIEPVVYRYAGANWLVNYLTVRADRGHYSQTLEFLKTTWKTLVPDIPFQYFFIRDQYKGMYHEEERLARIVGTFAVLAVLLSCLGLFAMVAFSSARRTKEIGIRKVNGARVAEMMAMLNKDFVKWVVIAFVIATPIAYYAMHKWLENFAYKTSLSWWIFALAGLLALGIALLTVSWQSWKAATRNPVEALRYE